MPSPFPGMNPYLEQNDAWEDFHHGFNHQARGLLNAQVGADFFVKVAFRLCFHEPAARERIARGNIGVDEDKQAYLEIRECRTRNVVTVIELLSPSNKNGDPDGLAYIGKRNTLLGSPVHFVEIDLLRGGQRPQPPAKPPCDYCALVSRHNYRPNVGFWPIRLRERLPVLPIPLTSPDADVTLDLQDVLHKAYDAAGFAKYIYKDHPEPPLSPEDAAWAQEILASANIRTSV